MVKGLHPFFHLRRISFHCKKRFLCFTGEIEEKFPHRYFQFFLYQIGINLKLAMVPFRMYSSFTSSRGYSASRIMDQSPRR